MTPKFYILQQMDIIHLTNKCKKERKKTFVYSCKPRIDFFSILFICNYSIPLASVLCMEHQLLTIGSDARSRDAIGIIMRGGAASRSVATAVPSTRSPTLLQGLENDWTRVLFGSPRSSMENPARPARSHQCSHQNQQNHHHDCNF
ncbi:hypothetical protein EUGRSUZ_H01275 [Eucalyptus grandis]|uniref:Uncharacterized protein n=2 Tax=Eucalyptus grandis TaxID=71139 RepID=A0ACC3JPU5_EUCGR|nr:hypothetical protein EUGRSUZ_H01275 [Eucalyptus grandis]